MQLWVWETGWSGTGEVRPITRPLNVNVRKCVCDSPGDLAKMELLTQVALGTA